MTSKAYIQEIGYENTKAAFARSCEKLGTAYLDLYLDLYLIHMPFADYYGAWRAMEELYKEGRIRAIGISNFLPDRLIDFCENVSVMPTVNQLEIHPFYQRREELVLMADYGISAEGWAPFAEGVNGMFTNPVLTTIAKAHGKTVAQVILRWNIQRQIICIPKSVHRNRMEKNRDIWDFTLSDEDMKRIAALDLQRPQMFDPRKPSEVKRVYDYLNHPVVTSL